MNLTSSEIRKRFLDFFEKRGHAIVPSAPLVPENDPSVLFNVAGMQPMVPFLMGEKHPKGNRIADAQKCLRTNDIEEVGDNTHMTFFEMLGNWSLGDYFKEDAIKWSYEFLTSKEEGLGLDVNRLYVTVFEGNEDAPKDVEAYEIWKSIFTEAGLNPEERIFWGVEDNWWEAGENGPCGPDSEMFYDRTEKGLGGLTQKEFFEADEKQEVVEIWNDVFMEYQKKDGKVVGKLENRNIDTGAGLERLAAIMEDKESPYDTSMFFEEIKILEKESGKKYLENKKDFRVILDHLRSATFLISDGVIPGNKDQGYILRRLLRRAVLKLKNIEFDYASVEEIINSYIKKYSATYGNLKEKENQIKDEIKKEIKKFEKTLISGLREFEKIINPEIKNNHIQKIEFGMCEADGRALNEISGEDAFKLFASYGFPLELIQEEAEKNGFIVDEAGFNEKMKDHTEKSKTASVGKFKGGMGGDSEKITAFHTVTHLLLAALKKFVGEHVSQKGSNITEERARFDFNNDEKVQKDIQEKIENWINDVIEKGVDISYVEMDKKDAEKDENITGSFWEKYPDIVKVWTIGEEEKFSQELCNGPHVKNTGDIAKFGKVKIKKEESSSAGIRRMKLVFVED